MTKVPEPIILEHRVDLYIPSQCVCGAKLPEHLRKKVLEEIKSKFDNWFGGHTEISVKGDWQLPDGTIAKEEIADIFSFCTGRALEQHQEDVDQQAVKIANQLTQDRVLRVFDNLKVALWPNTLTDLQPRKNCVCHGGATAAVGVTPKFTEIGKADRLSKMLVIQGILRSFNSAEHARKLFCDVLNYNYAKGELPWTKWPDGIRSLLAGAPTVLADHNGFKILYLRVSADELRRGAGRQVIQRIYKDDPTFRGLIVVSDQPQKRWELVNVKVHSDDSSRLVLRRMRVNVEAVRTATERLATLEIGEAEDASVAREELQRRLDQAFDVEAVTKAFFADVANWYFWALKHVRFPKDAPKEEDGHDHVSVIRLITRLIFCWFVKEKRLIPPDLFNERKLADLLVGFAPGKVSNKNSVFYKAILQNLFFATLNTEMDKRNWRRNGQNFMAHSLYRYKDLFVHPDEALSLFKNIPFLNGGLFECLDKILGDKDHPHYERIDGFSDRADSQPTVPDFLFFGEEREVDLSEDYGDKKFKKVKVRGLIHTLNHYHFTVEESTPLEEEVALDPELAGKIFENLLAAYNPETGATARKQTGSYYTPREIVNYMVDEALIACLEGKVDGAFPEAMDTEPRLRHLFSYEEEGHRFATNEVEVLVTGIDQLKALDPAVGSGAFPMGILHKLVFILGRLDPRNEKWKERQKERLKDAIKTAERIEDPIIRESTLHDLDQQLYGIDEAFEKNTLDYSRKLYLIENCLYGVDIQPIAVQIAKMRFFISLVADQNVDRSAENLGVRPLPNLETKLVAANTLIGIDKPKQMKFRNPGIDALEGELRRVREKHFLAKTPSAKAKCREQDKKLRDEIAELLRKDGWEDKTAKQLASWDPYDQNASAEFFDPEWMFGVTNGYHVIITNPPYLKERDNKHVFDVVTTTLWGKQYHEGKMDFWFFFLHRALEIAARKGIIAFITSRYWLNSAGAKKLVQHIKSVAALFHVVDIMDLPVFEHVAGYHMLHFYRAGGENATCVTKRLSGDLWHLTSPIPTERVAILSRPCSDLFTSSGDIQLYETELKLQAPQTLGELFEVSQGVVQNPDKVSVAAAKRFNLPRGNGVFVLETSELRRLNLTANERAFVKPFFDESSVERFHLDRSSLKHLLYLTKKNCVSLRGLPNLRLHLARYRAIMEERRETKKGTIEWFQLHWPRDPRFFESPKIVLPSMFLNPNAAYVEKAAYFGLGSNVVIGGNNNFTLLALCGILNSKLAQYWFATQGKKRGVGVDIGVDRLRQFPLPLTDSQIDLIAKAVGSIVYAKRKSHNTDTSSLEREIDRLVYELYRLTKDEIKIVEGGR